MGELRRQRGLGTSYINTTQYRAPVYTVPAGQPTVTVILDSQYAGARPSQAWEEVPLPAGARPAPGSDGRLVVLQPSTDTMWEFWRLHRRLSGWHAGWGGRMIGVSTNIGTYTDPPGWGASATGIPILGGLMRIDELRERRIDHGLALTIPEARARVYSWPASRTDGQVESPTAIPQGTRFRLDPAGLSKLDGTRSCATMAGPPSDYGLVVRDRGGGVGFYGEDPTPTGTNPYAGPRLVRGQVAGHADAAVPVGAPAGAADEAADAARRDRHTSPQAACSHSRARGTRTPTCASSSPATP